MESHTSASYGFTSISPFSHDFKSYLQGCLGEIEMDASRASLCRQKARSNTSGIRLFRSSSTVTLHHSEAFNATLRLQGQNAV